MLSGSRQRTLFHRFVGNRESAFLDLTKKMETLVKGVMGGEAKVM